MEELLELIEQNKFKEVKALLTEMPEQDIADLLEEIDLPKNLITVFKLLPKDIGAEVFSYLTSDVQENLARALNDKELSFLLEEMYLDDAVDFVEEMPANLVERSLKASTPETRALINKYLMYNEDSAGSIMTPEFIFVKEDSTVSEAIKKIREVGENVETVNVIYVTDNKRVLKGVLSIRTLILSKEYKLIKDIMCSNVIFADTNADQESIANLFKQYGFLALPIVDKEQRLVGIVTVDDIIDVMTEEATEDIAVMAAITPTEKPYLKTSVWRIWLSRAPWLMLLMITATFTGLIISKNEEMLNSGLYGILLTACIPMLMDTGGNAGGQASATIVRGIALEEISFKDIFRVIWKEIRVALILGLTLSIVCFGKIMLVDGLIFGTPGVCVKSALIIALSMYVTIMLAKIVGASLPLLAKKCKLDPAVMASPFITTIVDIVSLLVYCFLATTLLM